MRVPRTRALISNNVHHYKRTAQIGNIITSEIAGVPANTFASYQFTIGQIADVTDFTALYDQYRINAIKLEFIPTNSGVDGNPNSTMNYDHKKKDRKSLGGFLLTDDRRGYHDDGTLI